MVWDEMRWDECLWMYCAVLYCAVFYAMSLLQYVAMSKPIKRSFSFRKRKLASTLLLENRNRGQYVIVMTSSPKTLPHYCCSLYHRKAPKRLNKKLTRNAIVREYSSQSSIQQQQNRTVALPTLTSQYSTVWYSIYITIQLFISISISIAISYYWSVLQ